MLIPIHQINYTLIYAKKYLEIDSDPEVLSGVVVAGDTIWWI